MNELGRLEDLPLDYREALTRLNLVPLWPSLRAVLPAGKPQPKTRATFWSYEALRLHGNDWVQALDLYQRSRITRTGRIVLSGREMGRLYHARGVERLIRNSLWKGRSQERFYDAMDWLYGWNADNCLAQD